MNTFVFRTSTNSNPRHACIKWALFPPTQLEQQRARGMRVSVSEMPRHPHARAVASPLSSAYGVSS
eukprot:6205541-Pleurochrysis_carterae.AAC.2